MIFKAFFFTSFLLVVLHLCSAAFNVKQCYECEYFDKDGSSATNDERCKDSSPPEEYLVDCGNGAEDGPTQWQCIKVTGRIEVDEENFNYVKRACSPGITYDTCKECKDTKTYETRYGFVKRGKHCVCDDNDGCNSAGGLAFNIITLSVGLFAAVILKL